LPIEDITFDPQTIQILACGNTLRGDDGVGSRIAALLEESPPCEGMHVTFVPQLLPEHAELVSAADQVIFFDCSALTPAGKVSVIPVEPPASSPTSFTHNLDPAMLLRLAQDLYGRTPASATLITVGGESFELNEELSASVAAAIPEALDTLRLVCTDRAGTSTSYR
jgi:hydrogenase maturation protease